MIIDAHTHIFPEPIRCGRQRFFPEEPAFALLYGSPKSRMAGVGELLGAMDANGVDKSVVFGFPWRDPETFRMHNDYVMEAVTRHPARLIGLACFDPAHPAAAREAERCIAGGLVGVGELAFYRSGIDAAALDRLAPVMDLCRARALPVLIHTNEPVGHAYPGKTPVTLAEIYGMVGRFPDNKIILAHWGGGLFFFQLLKKEVRERLGNVYFDTAASPYLYDPAVYRIAVRTTGCEKIIFGSDFPLLAPKRYFEEMRQAGLSPGECERICGANAASVFGFAPGKGG
jgi:hypothetical protein